jgi:hypothetical protein
MPCVRARCCVMNRRAFFMREDRHAGFIGCVSWCHSQTVLSLLEQQHSSETTYLTPTISLFFLSTVFSFRFFLLSGWSELQKERIAEDNEILSFLFLSIDDMPLSWGVIYLCCSAISCDGKHISVNFGHNP